jgi:hypothetical protein
MVQKKHIVNMFLNVGEGGKRETKYAHGCVPWQLGK